MKITIPSWLNEIKMSLGYGICLIAISTMLGQVLLEAANNANPEYQYMLFIFAQIVMSPAILCRQLMIYAGWSNKVILDSITGKSMLYLSILIVYSMIAHVLIKSYKRFSPNVKESKELDLHSTDEI